MKSRLSHLLLSFGFLAALHLRAEEPAKTTPASGTPATAPAADPVVMIVDLRQNLSGFFYYGTWDDKVVAAKSGLMVQGDKGAQGQGGFGRNVEPALDLGAAQFVEVALGVVPGNEVPYITIALNDADGTQVSARVLIDQLVPGSPVWLRVRRDDFKPNPREPGTDPKFDWTTVARWHLQGDWSTAKPCSVIFIALRARK